ncbi:hypothetical protein LUZ62_062084 [Rhynchospora pubera]|uniref:Uncharacterized protein n=1 Tax=Rhynchospora pubera TaxID=906938 RepID=A0AAV8EHV6_9POAL|nr:hypothetical protein LUZ62_062084 [Rhynchospora pubera]
MGQSGSSQRRNETSQGGRGCFAVIKEQRSRFHILKRCVVMLLCWHKYGKY